MLPSESGAGEVGGPLPGPVQVALEVRTPHECGSTRRSEHVFGVLADRFEQAVPDPSVVAGCDDDE